VLADRRRPVDCNMTPHLSLVKDNFICKI